MSAGPPRRRRLRLSVLWRRGQRDEAAVEVGVGRSARQGVVSRLDAAVRCSRRRRSLRGLPLGTAARPRSPFSGGRGRHPALGAVSAGGQPRLVSLPAEGRAFIVIVRDSRQLNSQRPRRAGWMGGRLQGSYHYSVTPLSPTCAAFCLSTSARFSAPVCTPRTLARRQEPLPERGTGWSRPRYGISPATAQDMPWTGSLEETDLSGTSRTTEPAGRRRRPPGVDFACPRARRAGVDYGCRYCGDVVNVMKLPSRLASALGASGVVSRLAVRSPRYRRRRASFQGGRGRRLDAAVRCSRRRRSLSGTTGAWNRRSASFAVFGRAGGDAWGDALGDAATLGCSIRRVGGGRLNVSPPRDWTSSTRASGSARTRQPCRARSR